MIIMIQPTPETILPIPKSECYELLSYHSLAALNHLKINNKNKYNHELNTLSSFCAILIISHSESPEAIIRFMEETLENAYSIEYEKLTSDIQLLFEKRKQASLHTFHGEHEVENLSLQISALEYRKRLPVKEMIQTVIHDAIAKTHNEYGLEVSDEIRVHLQKYTIANQECQEIVTLGKTQ